MKTWRKENCITSVHKHDPLLADGSKVGRSNGCGVMIIILLSIRIVIGSLGYQHACLFRTHNKTLYYTLCGKQNRKIYEKYGLHGVYKANEYN